MSKGLLFWIIYLIALIFYLFFNWPLTALSFGGLLFFILVGLLGWQLFGPPVR